jgi:protein-tyrosine phosphatase
MRRVRDYSLWLGHVGDARDQGVLFAAGVEAVVDLALDEVPVPLARELVSCRFPLIDGVGNPRWLLRAAVETVAGLIRAGVPTLVYCGAGMSRTPAVAGAAIALVRGCPPAEGLALVLQSGAADVSPALWSEIRAATRSD